MKIHNDPKNDPRQPIWDRLYACLEKTHFRVGNAMFPFTGSAHHAHGLPVLDDPGVQRSIARLLAGTKDGRENEVLNICAELGEFWLNDPDNARHMLRNDVQASVRGLRMMASKYETKTLAA